MYDAIDILSVAGVIIGLSGIALAYHFARTPGQLAILCESASIRHRKARGRSDDLQVRYDSQSISENLVLATVAILNSGRKDIRARMINQPLSIAGPTGWRLLGGKVVSQSPGVGAETENLGEHLAIQFDFLKTGEFIRCEVLFELQDSELSKSRSLEDLALKIRASARIEDTRAKMRRLQVPSKSELFSTRFGFIMALCLTFFGIGGITKLDAQFGALMFRLPERLSFRGVELYTDTLASSEVCSLIDSVGHAAAPISIVLPSMLHTTLDTTASITGGTELSELRRIAEVLRARETESSFGLWGLVFFIPAAMLGPIGLKYAGTEWRNHILYRKYLRA